MGIFWNNYLLNTFVLFSDLNNKIVKKNKCFYKRITPILTYFICYLSLLYYFPTTDYCFINIAKKGKYYVIIAVSLNYNGNIFLD